MVQPTKFELPKNAQKSNLNIFSMKTNETDSEDEEEAVGEIIFFGTKVQKKCNSRKMIIHLVESD